MEDTQIFQTMLKPPKGILAPDLEELESLLTILSNIVVDFPEIAEIDINPLVIADGKIAAVDARIVIDESVLEGKPRMPHLVLTPYPTRYVAPWRLSDGTEVLLRPIRPEDEPMISELLATVSKKTLHDRFLGEVFEFDHSRLVRFTNIDYDREIAIVAELTHGKKKRIIGVGRLTGEADRGGGEFAVLVHDEFQGRGLGFKLIDVIIGIARDKGFEQIKGYISADNRRMITLVHELGFTDVCREEGVCTVQLQLV
jgi:acetyltransferase